MLFWYMFIVYLFEFKEDCSIFKEAHICSRTSEVKQAIEQLISGPIQYGLFGYCEDEFTEYNELPWEWYVASIW